VVVILSDQLLFFRNKNKFSQFDIAEKLNVTQQSVSNWETGLRVPSVEILTKLSEIYGCTLDELVKGDDPDRLQGDNNA